MTPGPKPTPKPETRREADLVFEHRTEPPGRFWLSPGARLGFAAVILGFVMLFLFTGVPAIQAKHEAELAAKVRITSQRNGAMLLHTYDCTYGNALRAVLKAAARDKRVTQSLSLQGRRSNLRVYRRTHDRTALRAAHRSLEGYRSAKRTANRYGSLAASLKPLGRNFQGIPIPPCPKR